MPWQARKPNRVNSIRFLRFRKYIWEGRNANERWRSKFWVDHSFPLKGNYVGSEGKLIRDFRLREVSPMVDSEMGLSDLLLCCKGMEDDAHQFF